MNEQTTPSRKPIPEVDVHVMLLKFRNAGIGPAKISEETGISVDTLRGYSSKRQKRPNFDYVRRIYNLAVDRLTDDELRQCVQ